MQQLQAVTEALKMGPADSDSLGNDWREGFQKALAKVLGDLVKAIALAVAAAGEQGQAAGERRKREWSRSPMR
eukprot:2498603-Alexandrium_andersonii.AAC.1